MASVNRVFLLGNLCGDPEIRYTGSGQAVANFRVATNEVWSDKEGKRQERAEFHRIVVWGKQAESCAEYLKKGRSVHIEGRIQTRQWEDKNGAKQYTTEIVADRVTFVGGARGEEQRSTQSNDDDPRGRRAPTQDTLPPLDDSDLPF